jgi:hypothetical protein
MEVKKGDDGRITRIYEHPKTGEVFVIPDPGLRLDQLAAVQAEVSALLAPEPAPLEPQPEPAAS